MGARKGKHNKTKNPGPHPDWHGLKVAQARRFQVSSDTTEVSQQPPPQPAPCGKGGQEGKAEELVFYIWVKIIPQFADT